MLEGFCVSRGRDICDYDPCTSRVTCSKEYERSPAISKGFPSVQSPRAPSTSLDSDANLSHSPRSQQVDSKWRDSSGSWRLPLIGLFFVAVIQFRSFVSLEFALDENRESLLGRESLLSSAMSRDGVHNDRMIHNESEFGGALQSENASSNNEYIHDLADRAPSEYQVSESASEAVAWNGHGPVAESTTSLSEHGQEGNQVLEDKKEQSRRNEFFSISFWLTYTAFLLASCAIIRFNGRCTDSLNDVSFHECESPLIDQVGKALERSAGSRKDGSKNLDGPKCLTCGSQFIALQKLKTGPLRNRSKREQNSSSEKAMKSN